jgi:DNA helicase-2/ATP-dependent DNA helicase PcrA
MIKNPTAEQASIIASTTKVQLVDAVAGSGKTTTLAMLAREWTLRSDVKGRIACLSFTDSAKRRFKEKLTQEGVPNSVIPATVSEFAQFATNCLIRSGCIDRPYIVHSAIEIRTNVVNAANIIWEKYEQLGESDFDFAFENNTARIDQLLQILKKLKAQLKAHQFEHDDFYLWAHELAEELNVPVEAIEICAAHERMRRRMPGEFEWQTEDDIVPDLVRLLQYNPAAIAAIPRVSLILIDEWHDVNAAEFELIRIVRRGARLIVVADRDQVIDEARGAELRLSTTDFLNAYPNAGQFPLSRSHRFGQSLARCLEKVASRNVESVVGLHTVVRKLRYDPTIRTSCAAIVVDQVQKLHGDKQKTSYSDIAIIVREEDQSIEIENLLLEAEIPYSCFGVVSYLLRPEILLLRALLHLVSGSYEQLRQDQETARQMVGALAMFVSISRNPKHWDVDYHSGSKAFVDPLEQAMDMVAKEPSVLQFFFSGVLCQVRDYDRDSVRRWKTRFTQVVEELKRQAHVTSAADLLRQANSLLDLPAAVNRALLQRSRADSAIRSVQSFIAFADNFGSTNVVDFLNELRDRQSKLASRTATQRKRHQLTLATVKSAKGHEWAHVIIPYVQSGEFPRSTNLAEELRYFYVATTRAKESLSIAEPGDNFDDYRSTLALS